MVAKTTLQRYITRLDDAILSNDVSAAEDLQDEILAALGSDIDGLKHGLENYAFCAAERTPVRLPADTRRRQRTAL